MGMRFRTASFIVTLALLCAAMFGQDQADKVVRISGRVVDPVGTAIWRATVTFKEVGANQATAILYSDRNGDFTFPAVSPKTYELVVEVPYFITVRRGTVRTDSGKEIQLGNIVMEVDKDQTPIFADYVPAPQAESKPVLQFDDFRVATRFQKRKDEAFLAWPDG